MANSSLYRTGEQEPVVNKGHGTGALGPSDSTDSGSDIAGGPGLNAPDELGLDRGTTSDADYGGPASNAGADVGDADLDSDTDRYGTGERGAAGRDATIPVDEVLTEDTVETSPGEETPHDFSRHGRRGRRTSDAIDEAADDQIGSADEVEQQDAPSGGEQPGLISGGIGGPSGTGNSGGKVGPGSGRNSGRR